MLEVYRAADYEFAPGVAARTASAEDLIVFKAFAAVSRCCPSPREWMRTAPRPDRQ